MAEKTIKKLIKSAKKEYYQNYRKQHPEKYVKAQQRFWKKKAQEKKERSAN